MEQCNQAGCDRPWVHEVVGENGPVYYACDEHLAFFEQLADGTMTEWTGESYRMTPGGMEANPDNPPLADHEE